MRLTYAGNLENLKDLSLKETIRFYMVILQMRSISIPFLQNTRFDDVIHLAPNLM